MTHDEFKSLIRQPDMVTAQHVVELKEMIELYPYFYPARLFYTKALQKSNSIYFESNIKVALLYSPSRRWLYYYIHPEKKLSNEPYQRERNRNSSGGYFDIIDVVESKGGDTKKSLKNLADKLKSARAMVVNMPYVHKNSIKEPETISVLKEKEDVKVLNVIRVIKGVENLNFSNQITNITEVKNQKNVIEDYFSSIEPEITEINAKKLISERKYKDAIVILKQLNLNNPKKSVYFADQIRFLEKVIETSKK